jgi:RimJ/RimL family protein N-acetyltransferase
LESAGYEQEQHLYGVELDVQGWRDPGIQKVPGITIVSWSDLPDIEANRLKLFELYYATDSDTPGIELWGQPGYEEWVPSIFNARWFRPEGCLIAVAEDDSWVGLSLIGPLSEEDFTTDFTGVLQAHRGRGIALALKEAGVRWARQQGGLRMHTFNDDRNGPMRAINAKLGFKAKTGWRMMKKQP